MQTRKLTLIAGLISLAVLTGCDDLGEALGMEHSKPDEGTIVTNQPLALPPDYTLLPPRETPKGEDTASTDHPKSTDPDLEKHH